MHSDQDLPPSAATATTAAARRPAAGEARWHVRLLGGFDLHDGRQHLTRLSSRAVTALLARLAMWPERAHAREELVELLWPGVTLAVGRNRLRQALSTLKSLLEPPGAVHWPVLLADRLSVRVVPGRLACDVPHFEYAVREGRHDEARALYRGELMPGYYDEWVNDERRRLAALHERCQERIERSPAAVRSPAAQPPQRPPVPPGLPDIAGASIPHYLTRIFGADQQAARLRGLLLAQRLVTLLGPGGCGKTRLAVELAHALRETSAFEQGSSAVAVPPFDLVAFVPLVGCRCAADLLDALRTTLGLRSGGGDPLAPLLQALADRQALLVLDNFEQLDEDSGALVAQLSTRLPRLHQLVTSRRPLALDGEREFRVATLELPVVGVELDAAAMNPAVALFVDRARAVRPDFHLNRGNAGALVALVQLLDGMPLAIELAAARVRSLAPAEMLARLAGAGTGALELLSRAGPRGGTDRRHASMQTVMAWSWQQLTPAQRDLLSALTVFNGGCKPEAAAAVGGEDAHGMPMHIDALCAHSLLRMQEMPDGDARITLAEPLRAFAAAQLDADRARQLRSRHRAWWPRWAEGFGATPPLAQVRREFPNIVAALASAVADGAPADAVHIVLALRSAFNEIALPTGGIALLRTALEQVEDPALGSRGHSLLGALCFEAGEGESALWHAERGLALARPLAPADAAVLPRALHVLASIRWRATRERGAVDALLDEAAPLAARGRDLAALASVSALRAFMANVERDYARGEALHRLALQYWQRLGNLHTINGGLYNLAICAFNGRRWSEVLERLDTVCRTARSHEDWEQLSDALNVLGNTRAELRDWPGALAAYRECVRVAWGTMETHALAYGLWNLPRTLAHLRQPQEAGRLMSFAAHFWERHFGVLTAGDRPYLRRARRLVSVQLGAARWEALWGEGAAMPLADALRLALGESRRPDAVHDIDTR